MEITQDELKAHLMQTNEEFRHLALQHAELKKRVMELEDKAHPSLEEQLEEAALKKQKLQLKDLMASLLSRHKMEQQVA